MPDKELTPVEQALVDHVHRGEWYDLADGSDAADEVSMQSWGDARTCRAQVIRDILRGRLVPDPDPHGLRLRGARISGRLDLENLTTQVNFELKDCLLEAGILARDACLAGVGLSGCRIDHPTEPPFDGARMVCSLLVLDKTKIIGHAANGAVNLVGARIGGQVSFSCVELLNDSGPALNAVGVQVSRSMLLRGRFTGNSDSGAVKLDGAHIGSLICDNAELHNDSGPAVAADGLRVDQSMVFRNKTTAIGNGDSGAVNLVGAYVGTTLSFKEVELHNDSGPALNAAGVQVGQGILLHRRFTGGGCSGAVNLVGAQIGGLVCGGGAELSNDSGPALIADGLQVRQSVFFVGEFNGNSNLAAVNLYRTGVGGDISFGEAKLRNDSGPALAANGLQVGRTISLLGEFSGSGNVAVDLTGTQVGGTFHFNPKKLSHSDSHRLITVDGLIYPGVPELVYVQDWLRLLRHGTPRYAAQPYQQLAAGCRALGHDQQARAILIAQRDDQLARTHLGWPERAWAWTTKVTLGYGYQPWRALLFLVAVVAFSCVLTVVLGSHGALAQTGRVGTHGRPCTVIQQVSVGLDLNLPVGSTLARADCGLASDPGHATAAWLAVTGWVLRILAWAFAALFVAGFTSAVRKS